MKLCLHNHSKDQIFFLIKKNSFWFHAQLSESNNLIFLSFDLNFSLKTKVIKSNRVFFITSKIKY